MRSKEPAQVVLFWAAARNAFWVTFGADLVKCEPVHEFTGG